jgi:hypothetical protein
MLILKLVVGQMALFEWSGRQERDLYSGRIFKTDAKIG